MKQIIKNKLKRFPHVYRFASLIYLKYQSLRARGQWRALENQKNIYLELGSGPRHGTNGWITVDQAGADIVWDLRRGIPIQDGSVDKIYSSHLLEHIPYADLLKFLKECRRVLNDGGEFIVCVPNARLYIDAYVNRTLFIERSKWYQPAMVDTGSALDQVNYIAHLGGEHKTLFDEEFLCNLLEKVGFQNVGLRNFDPSLDLQERHFESIYAIGTKS